MPHQHKLIHANNANPQIVICLHCFGPSNQECYQCKDGYYFEGTTCIQCDIVNSFCQTCQFNYNYCTSCQTGYTLVGFQCLNTGCVSGQYFDQQLNICKKCPKNCSECSNQNFCTKCDEIFYTLKDGECVRRCEKGCIIVLQL
ncbi:Insulin-like growth factor binding protein, N-terminal [Pseudocohnilembus persalinus]|uniref:Insulin-like growth factor binding protein, N-terminal n=1 Tax=Pseudocohnilembus persalinus TaxID=266149 RepID=A0A0V0QS05_PSEPJ|nr:Insulin-like growth factor binding protein, N-terminal [Pseudocohnilembus persalinus]|eukprot:KRX04792.1 Insulin-like growth factor binding protein, N-terminal [Pseudocohnilembus persalinus]